MAKEASKSDEILMLKLAKGKEEAFDILFKRYKKPLLNYLDRLTFNQGVAEDLFQEVFLAIFKKRRYFKKDLSFKPWLYTIATNITKNFFKREAKKAHMSLNKERVKNQKETFADAVSDNLPEPLEGLQEKEFQKELRLAIEGLPFNERECFILSRYEGFTYPEIAKLLGISISAIKMRVHRAHKRLDEVLHKFFD